VGLEQGGRLLGRSSTECGHDGLVLGERRQRRPWGGTPAEVAGTEQAVAETAELGVTGRLEEGPVKMGLGDRLVDQPGCCGHRVGPAPLDEPVEGTGVGPMAEGHDGCPFDAHPASDRVGGSGRAANRVGGGGHGRAPWGMAARI
jgi:hypothetical protein